MFKIVPRDEKFFDQIEQLSSLVKTASGHGAERPLDLGQTHPVGLDFDVPLRGRRRRGSVLLTPHLPATALRQRRCKVMQ